MLKVVFCLLSGLILIFINFPFLFYSFDSDQLMKDNNAEINLSSLTNFKWDYAILWVSNEDFKKLDFYKNNILVFSDNYSVAGNGDAVSQYLFENKSLDLSSHKNIDSYKCSYSSSIKFKNKESLSEGRILEYNYEPSFGCVPQEAKRQEP